ncbi:MAG TPA: phosphoglucomutase [Elusimicrobia bacterium]|jgi:phosphoglucomutase|nr:phosphoglucomutase [Elusimicrobiota bacterium]
MNNYQSPIKFGTAGWRAIIGEEFNFHNVKIVTQAIADYLKTFNVPFGPSSLRPEASGQRAGRGQRSTLNVVVGYDTRFLAEEFAQTAACVLAANGIKVNLSDNSLPTPVFAYEIIFRRNAGGINFTASHNPSEYQGMKFSLSGGLPASVEITKKIEKNILKFIEHSKRIREIPFLEGKKKKLINFFSGEENYFQQIEKIINFDLLKKTNLRIVVDLLYGTGKGYLDELLRQTRNEICVIHNWRDVLFGGRTSEPNEKNLEEAKKIMKKMNADLCLATDGDADRFGIIDSDWTYLSPNQILGLLFWYLKQTRKWDGSVVRSVMTTHFLDVLAKKYNIPVRETPVGFKHIGEVMSKEPVIIGGEESGGLSVYGHTPEKDGILACLLVSELLAWAKKGGYAKKFSSLKKILAYLYSEVGSFYTGRINFSLSAEKMSLLEKRLSAFEKKIDGEKIEKIVRLDGYKFIFADGSWLGFRLSGTEPVVRCYIESGNKKKLNYLKNLGEKICRS